MADEADVGNEMAEKLNSAYLSLRKPNGPEATGKCLHCGEEVGGRWCDADCRDAWEKRQRKNL